MNDKDNTTTFKAWANKAIAQHADKIFKHEAKVIKDKDPEKLHQMRVGVRRLRSAINAFAIALDLPPMVTDKNLGKIGRTLGKLRDLDVLMAELSNNYRPQLPKKERQSLDEVLVSLHKQRKHKLQQVRQTLKGQFYLDFKQELSEWLSKPKYQPIGDLDLKFVLPDLLLPQVSLLLLHPGWLVGVKPETLKTGDEIQITPISENKAVKLLDRQETILHDLRKVAKKARYNLELFTQFYDVRYQDYINKIEQVQEVLGEIQDAYVLRAVLEKILKAPIKHKMPELSALLANNRYQKWQQWSILQQQFLADETRRELRGIICQVNDREIQRLITER